MVELILSIIAISISLISFILSVYSFFHSKNVCFAELTGFKDSSMSLFKNHILIAQKETITQEELKTINEDISNFKNAFFASIGKNSNKGKKIKRLMIEYEDALCAAYQYKDEERFMKLERIFSKIRKVTKSLL